jgi:hypothetical protein
MEIWKDIKDYEGLYQVSNLGKVKSLKFGKEKILKPGKSKKGYLAVVLCDNTIRKTFKVHRLIALTFIDNLHNKPQINHINGIKLDNRVDNLEWCTNGENGKHAFDNGLRIPQKGENRYNSKLKEFQVINIKKDNRSHRVIAKDYNVDHSLIGLIKRGKCWKHLN